MERIRIRLAALAASLTTGSAVLALLVTTLLSSPGAYAADVFTDVRGCV